MNTLVSLSNSWSRLRKKIAIKKLTTEKSSNTHIHTPPTTEVLPLPPPWIHTLPDELISYILVTTANSMSASAIDPSQELDTDIPRSELPLLTQVVCRRWMYIVRGTQLLWTVLDIKKDRKTNYRLYAERSGVLPLEVHLEAIPDLHRYPDSQDRKVAVLIKSHTHRIQRLRIRAATWEDVERCLPALPQTIPNLLELGISIKPRRLRNIIRLNIILPRLRSLSVHYFPHGWPDSCNHYNPDLEEIHLVGSATWPRGIDDLAHLLCLHPNFRKLVFYEGLIWDHEGEPVPEPPVLERLETLSLKRYSVRELVRVLSLVVAPQLRVLCFVELSRPYERDPETVTLYFPMLETLELELVMNPRFALEITKQVPSVRHLTLRRPYYFSEDMDPAWDGLLVHWQSLPHPLPLETLVIEGVQATNLATFLEDNRNRVVPLLRKVSIHYRDTFLSKDEGQFVVAAETRRRLSATVELEILGVSDVALRGRRGVNSWEQEQEWANKFYEFLD